jgi:large subunit ribosomal protein L31
VCLIKFKLKKTGNSFLLRLFVFNFALRKIEDMKEGIHPEEYRKVVFKDLSNGETWITKTCAPAKETIEHNGEEMPLIKVEISNTSHPYFTGKMKFIDTAGRIDKFKTRYAKHIKK